MGIIESIIGLFVIGCILSIPLTFAGVLIQNLIRACKTNKEG